MQTYDENLLCMIIVTFLLLSLSVAAIEATAKKNITVKILILNNLSMILLLNSVSINFGGKDISGVLQGYYGCIK